MHAEFVGEVFRRRERHSRSGYTLDDWVVREVEEGDDVVAVSARGELLREVCRVVVLDADAREDDGEFFRADDLRLRRYLNRELVMRQPVAGEYRQLLSADKRHQRVYRGDACVYEVARVLARHRVQRQPVDVDALAAVYLAAAVARLAESVEGAPEHVLREMHLERLAEEAHLRRVRDEVAGAGEYLHERRLFAEGFYLPVADLSARVADVYELAVADAGDVLYENERPFYIFYANIFSLRHRYSLLSFFVRSAATRSRCSMMRPRTLSNPFSSSGGSSRRCVIASTDSSSLISEMGMSLWTRSRALW